MASSSAHTGAASGIDSLDELDDPDFAGLDIDAASTQTSAPASSDLTRRLFSLLSGLLRIHVQIAANEARRDQARLLRGAVCFALAGFLGFLTVILSEGLALWGFLQIPLRLPWALAALIACNLAVSGVLVLLGSRSLRSPVMPETRALLRRTLRSLFPV